MIRAFNEHGMAMLQPKWGPGRPPKFTDDQRKALVDLALSRPRYLGLPYAQWSLSRLREQAVQRGIVTSISEEWLRVILHEDDVSHQSIRTWKISPNPLFEEKKRKIDQLTRRRHNPPVVLSMDEIEPIQFDPSRRGGMVPSASAETGASNRPWSSDTTPSRIRLSRATIAPMGVRTFCAFSRRS